MLIDFRKRVVYHEGRTSKTDISVFGVKFDAKDKSHAKEWDLVIRTGEYSLIDQYRFKNKEVSDEHLQACHLLFQGLHTLYSNQDGDLTRAMKVDGINELVKLDVLVKRKRLVVKCASMYVDLKNMVMYTGTTGEFGNINRLMFGRLFNIRNKHAGFQYDFMLNRKEAELCSHIKIRDDAEFVVLRILLQKAYRDHVNVHGHADVPSSWIHKHLCTLCLPPVIEGQGLINQPMLVEDKRWKAHMDAARADSRGQ
eukprot:768373-Hanusia_phi.AAC.7